MKIAISQPTFLPWQGYFGLINYVDEFIFLDNVQFNKRSWQQRNFLIFNLEKKLITIPVKSKNLFNQIIKDVEIDYDHFVLEKFFSKLELSYKKTKFFDEYYVHIKDEFSKRYKYLVDLNINLIKKICDLININSKFLRSSELLNENNLKNIDLLSALSKKRNSDLYVSTLGAKPYLGDLECFSDTNISIKYFDYRNKPYKQLSKEFQSHISIIDLLFNEGKSSKEILNNNFFIV